MRPQSLTENIFAGDGRHEAHARQAGRKYFQSGIGGAYSMGRGLDGGGVSWGRLGLLAGREPGLANRRPPRIVFFTARSCNGDPRRPIFTVSIGDAFEYALAGGRSRSEER